MLSLDFELHICFLLYIIFDIIQFFIFDSIQFLFVYYNTLSDYIFRTMYHEYLTRFSFIPYLLWARFSHYSDSFRLMRWLVLLTIHRLKAYYLYNELALSIYCRIIIFSTIFYFKIHE